jgi:hypothetical protein
MASLSNVINYCRIVNGSKGFNDTKTQFINEITQDYNTAREDTVYRFDVLINSTDGKDIYVNDSEISIRGVIDLSKKPTADTEIEKRIQVYPNQIKQGDYIKFKENDTDTLRTYLIKSPIDKKHGYDEGVFEECNHVLKWINENGKIVERPCLLINNTKYTGGIKTQTEGITEVQAMINIVVRCDEETDKITYGKRFYAMKNAWRVTLIDDVTIENTYSFTLGKSSLTSNDNTILGICDYYAHKYIMTLPLISENIIIGGTYQIQPEVTDDGKPIVNPPVIYKSSNPNIATVNENGLVTSISEGNCIITVSIDDTSIDLNISVIAKSVTPTISYQVNPSNGTLLRLASSTSLVCNKYNDSALIPCNVQYALDTNGQNLLSSKKIDIQYKETKDANGNSLGMNIVWIKNLNCTTANSFSITINDKLDGTVISTQTIQLKGV